MDQVVAMRRQEDTTYHCPNYMDPEPTTLQQVPSELEKLKCSHLDHASLVKMVEEFANIVTDSSFLQADDEYEEPIKPCKPMRLRKATAPRDKQRAAVSSPSSIATDLMNQEEPRSCVSGISSQDPEQRSRLPLNLPLSAWRAQMSKWSYQAVSAFGLDRDTVAVAFSCLDRYMAVEVDESHPFAREDFQLISMTALYMSVKIMEPGKKLSIHALVDMSLGFYSASDVKEMESDILNVLNWRVNPPTPLAFASHYLDILQAQPCQASSYGPIQWGRIRNLTEQAVSDSFFVSHKASSIALAALLIVCKTTIRPSLVQQFLAIAQHDLGMDTNSHKFEAILQRLERLYHYSP
jgi:hypothetical protein